MFTLRIHFSLVLLAVACRHSPSEETGTLTDIDHDGDGYTTNQGDCDDENPAVHPGATETPYDGADQDCDGGDLVDVDGDGANGSLAGGDDCDDEDPTLGSKALDQDCDGVLTADDCDDHDPDSLTRAEDADCDGVLTAEDCDDANAEVGLASGDGDCDGALTAEDCDDADDTVGAVAEDADCDGTLTAEDCDDADPGLAAISEDADCDGVLTAEDCDDANPDLGAIAGDADCDGALTAEDCDDADPSNTARPDVDDLDCDGYPEDPSGGELTRIAGGNFDIGCTAGQSDCDADESPVFNITLTHDYYIGLTEVTQLQYETMMGTNPSYSTMLSDDYPVNEVTWYMAAAFTNALSTASGLTECYTCTGSGSTVECEEAMSPYDCDGYRLPTEAEWEVAARCGTDTLYAGSDNLDVVAWYQGNSGMTIHDVATRKPNACELSDMSGNVIEWVNDGYGPYTDESPIDPEGEPSGTFRVMRGGAYSCSHDSCERVAARSYWYPDYSVLSLGLRVARTIP